LVYCTKHHDPRISGGSLTRSAAATACHATKSTTATANPVSTVAPRRSSLVISPRARGAARQLFRLRNKAIDNPAESPRYNVDQYCERSQTRSPPYRFPVEPMFQVYPSSVGLLPFASLPHNQVADQNWLLMG